jgi:glycosyltransferase involved in cell wall biosynthesis
MTPRLTVVVMAFNEAENLDPVVRDIHASLSGLTDPPGRTPGPRHELLIVDDGSKDGTGPLADRLAGELPGVRVIHHGRNRGLGGVYRTGFAEAAGDLLTFFPADGQFSPSILKTFFPLMADQDLVLGYLPGRDPSILAKVLSGLERFLYRLLFGYMPRFQGVFMLRRGVLPALSLESDGYGWGVVTEMMIKVHRRGFRVLSVPIGALPRRSGQSKVRNARTIWVNLKQALVLSRTLRLTPPVRRGPAAAASPKAPGG